MNAPIIFHQKNLLFNNIFIKELQAKLKLYTSSNKSTEDLYITILMNGGSHPDGKYVIPADVLIRFIKEKTVLQCWQDYGYWTQTKVPVKLRPYFK